MSNYSQLLCGTWSLVVQGVVETNDRCEGTLTITGILTGAINLPDALGNTSFTGSYHPEQGTIQLLRPFSDGSRSIQNYQGSIDLSTSPISMQGQMRIDYGPGMAGINPVYEWSAQKQS